MDELKDISPELSKIERKNNFSVPDGYFEELSMNIQEKIHQSKKIEPAGWLALFKKPVYSVSFAMVVLLLITIPLSISLFRNQNTNGQIAYHNLEIADLDYFDISEDLLIEALSAGESLELESIIEDNEDEMVDYILDNVDYSTILDEL